MSRGIVKEDPLDQEWNSGNLLDRNERFQTDAEWHAKILEEIHDTGEDTKLILEDIRDHINYIRDYYERNPQPIVIERTINQPMSKWRFVFGWLIALLCVALIVSALDN